MATAFGLERRQVEREVSVWLLTEREPSGERPPTGFFMPTQPLPSSVPARIQWERHSSSVGLVSILDPYLQRPVVDATTGMVSVDVHLDIPLHEGRADLGRRKCRP